MRHVLLATFVLLVACGVSRPMRVHGLPITVVRRGDYSGEIALFGGASAHYAAEDAMLAHCAGRVRFVEADESAALAVRDPGETGKPRDVVDPRVERVFYVCVTRERRARER